MTSCAKIPFLKKKAKKNGKGLCSKLKVPKLVDKCWRIAIGQRSVMDHDSRTIDLGTRPDIANGTQS